MGLISRFQAMHKSIRNTIRNIFAPIAAVAIATMATGCADDLYNGVGEPNAEGMYGPFSLTVPLGASVNEVKSRSTFDLSDIQINNAWVGIFDATDGHLVGGSSRDFVNPSAPSTGHTDASIGDDYNMTFDNLYFNDMNRYAYIVGVVNYDKIKVHNEDSRLDGFADADGQISLKLALDSIRNLNDYLHLSVNTASAEAAVAEANAPLMSGVLSTGDANRQRHGNFTFSVNEKNEIEVQSNQYADAAKITLFDYDTKKVNPLPNGSFVHLRSLVNHIKVNVTVANGVTIENPTVEVYNVPKAVFVQERATVTDIPKDLKTAEAWAKISPAASDYVWGYTESPYVLTPGGSRVIDAENAGFFQDETDVMSQTNNAITFGYWHFENKHWGNSSCSTYIDREKRFGTSNVYSSLCPDVDRNFNNGATYMVLKGKVTQANGLTANAQFIIHEGYCSQPNGNAATTEGDAARDFSTFRNTEYTYNVEINGINSMILNVSQDGEIANPGVMGDVWNTEEMSAKTVERTGNSYDITIPEGDFFWCIFEGGKYYGIPMDDNFVNKNKYPLYPEFTQPEDLSGSGLYKYITLDGQNLAGITSFDKAENHTLAFASNTEANGSLYLCASQTSSDGRTIYYTLYKFTQTGKEMDVVRFDEANIIWHKDWHDWATQENTWCGSGNSAIDIIWKHDDRIQGYKLKVSGNDVNLPTITIDLTNPENVAKYIVEKNGQKIFKYRLSTANLPAKSESAANNYDLTIDVVVDESSYIKGDETFVSSCIRCSPSTWNFSSTKEWSTFDFANNTKYVDIEMRGLQLYCDPATDMKSSVNGTYVNFAAGNVNKKYFSFIPSKSGTLRVYATHTGGTELTDGSRQVVVYKDDGNGNFTEIARSGNVMPKKGDLTKPFVFNITVNAGELVEYRFLGSASIHFYNIEYIAN